MTQYSGIYTLQSQGQALTSGQWATDPYYKNTTLLLHADGVAGGAQNNTFLDSSSNAFAITRNGNTTQGSFTPYGPTWSNYFNGSSDLYTASNTALVLSTGSWTIEAFVFCTGGSGYRTVMSKRTGSTSEYEFGIDSSGYMYFYVGATVYATSVVVPLNTWVHLAVTYDGTNLRMFQNGVLTKTQAGVTAGSGAGTFGIAAEGGTGTQMWVGYLSNLRVVKGTAVYTAAFNPSTIPLTAISGTSMLTCQSNRLVDSSSYAFALSMVGSPSVQRFSPFAPQYQYTPAVIGGSGYFDGTGDYLSVANSSSLAWTGSQDGSMEAWVYLTSFSSGPVILSKSDISGTSYPNYDLAVNTSGNIVGVIGNSGSPGSAIATITGSTAMKLNAWNHLLFTRKYVGGGSQNEYRLFVNGVLDASTTAASPSDGRAGVLTIGTTNSGNNPTAGYIGDIRFSPNSIPTSYQTTSTTIGAVIFTPPTAPLTTTSQGATNVSLLTNYTNTGIYDNAMMNNLETLGNAQVSTSVAKYGSGSLYFDGTGDYLSGPTTPTTALGSGAYTVEFWLYKDSTGSGERGIFQTQTASLYGLSIFADGTTIYVDERTNSFDGSNPRISGTISQDTWIHVAVCRQTGTSGTLRAFVNGTQIGSSVTSNLRNLTSTGPIVVGNTAVASNPLKGYIDDLRITNGYARYTTTFTAPTAAFSNTGPV